MHQIFEKYKIIFSVAQPIIAASANNYVIGGTAVTLTCSSSSDTSGAGVYEWKKGSNVM